MHNLVSLICGGCHLEGRPIGKNAVPHFQSEFCMKNKLSIESRSAAAWSDTGRCSDEYYQTMTAWTVSNCRNGSREECRRLAVKYDETIDAFLAVSGELPFSATVEEDINRALHYKSLLSGDLVYFEARYGPIQTL
jgi:hypothetical protein